MAVTVDFNHSLESQAGAEKIWEQFELAMINSDDASIWPSNSFVLGNGLTEGSIIEMTYDLTFTNPTYKYIITEVIPYQQMSYESLTGEHPFVGGATITFSDDGIEWVGSYETRYSQWIERMFFRSYERRFFSELESSLSELR